MGGFGFSYIISPMEIFCFMIKIDNGPGGHTTILKNSW
jgi:hypothetical protein